MTLFLTSSPFVDGADRAILSDANGFIDRIREVLPPHPKALFITSNPEDRDMTCRFAAETTAAFAEFGMAFQSYHILDGFNAEDAGGLIADCDVIFLSGGHVPTQNAFFQEIGLRELLDDFPGVVVGISAGSMNCADTVYVQPEEEGESAPEFERFVPGLGLTDVNIWMDSGCMRISPLPTASVRCSSFCPTAATSIRMTAVCCCAALAICSATASWSC